MKAIGIYIYAGGFTHGVKKFFDVEAHFEHGPFGVATSKLNHPGLEVYQVPEEWPAASHSPDLVYCNPPCAPWSNAGSKLLKSGARDFTSGHDPRDLRVKCFEQAFGAGMTMRPKILVIESVQPAWRKGRPFIEGLAANAADDGYALTAVLHNAWDMGLPQIRKRVLFFFHRVAVDFRLFDREGPKTAGEALAGMTLPADPEPTSPRVVEILKHAKPGEKLKEVYDRMWGETLGRKGRPGFLHTRLNPDRPAPAITGGQSYYHWAEDRALSSRELAVICGYPETYQFVGSNSGKYAQVARAVTPPVGRWLGQIAAEAIAEGIPCEVQTKEVTLCLQR